jgi:hypothetical protein
LENRREEQILPGGRGGTSGKEEDGERRYRRVNIMEILCTHVCKWEKNDTC